MDAVDAPHGRGEDHGTAHPPRPALHTHQVQGTVAGPLAQTGAIYGDVHLAAPSHASAPVPRQLPSPPRHFTNRDVALDRLAGIQQRITQRQRRELVVVSGPGGVGKTSLAVHFLSSVADAFPDGQFYADLRGFSGGDPAEPGVVVDGLLRSLGVAAEAIPQEAAARAALWRTHTHGRRIIEHTGIADLRSLRTPTARDGA